MHGVPSVIRQGQPRSADHTRGLAGLQTENCYEQERPLHSSFLLNALHRISLICAFLWFESQKEEEGGNKKHFLSLVQNERKGESGCQTCRRTLPGPDVGHLTEGAKLSTPGTITGLWEPRFCGGRCRQALWWNFSYVTPQRWRPTTLVTFAGHDVSIFLSRYTMRGPVRWTSQEK